MTRPLRKPWWRWEPAPYVLLIVLLMATWSINPRTLPVFYWTSFAVTVVVAAVLLVLLIVSAARGRGNPDSSGILSSLNGIDLVPLPATDAPATPVLGTERHQQAIDATMSRVGSAPSAVLVPDATRWLGLRIRIAVHLVADNRVHHVGFLPDRTTEQYNSVLRALAAQRRFVSAPATLVTVERPERRSLAGRPARPPRAARAESASSGSERAASTSPVPERAASTSPVPERAERVEGRTPLRQVRLHLGGLSELTEEALSTKTRPTA